MSVETFPVVTRQTIYHQAVRYLSYREHAVSELRIKLLKKFDSESEVIFVLERLLREDLVSDQRFAEAYIRARVNKGFGPVHIGYELVNRGVTKRIAEKALNDCDFFWDDEINKVWRKKFKHIQLEDAQDKMQQWRFLQYRGFSHYQIKSLFSRFNHL